MSKSVLAFTFFILGSVVFGQGGTLRGIVKSGTDGNAIPFAKIFIIGADKGGQTDMDGLFSIPEIPAGTYTVRITSPQFSEFTKEVTIVTNQITELNVEMTEGKLINQ